MRPKFGAAYGLGASSMRKPFLAPSVSAGREELLFFVSGEDEGEFADLGQDNGDRGAIRSGYRSSRTVPRAARGLPSRMTARVATRL
jgi:hypothetical protein